MNIFATRTELMKSYAAHLKADGVELTITDHLAAGMVKYVPHIYKGGYVIPGFGYSIERIGKYVSADRAGFPNFVE